MLKADAQKGAAAKGGGTRHRIVEAALATLREQGFAGASARAIALRGNFNQALVFYHFGSVKDLLLAALDATSAARLARYQAAVTDANSPFELMRIARELHAEDLESGHVTVLAEMIAGSINDPELGAAIADRMQPWLDLAEDAIERGLAGSPFAGLLPTRDLAYALLSFFIGSDLLSTLDGDRSRAEGLFATAERLLPLLETLSTDV